MKKITANDPETRSADILADNVEQLKALFPEVVKEGKIDFEVLEQLLGDELDEKEERYGLNWHGKRRARQLALTPSTGTLRPCPEESVDWDTTQNLMIDGDNLEVLKLLQKSYAGRVKLIYIDPPYNTGKDFIYPDDFRNNIDNYLKLTGQIDGNGKKISSNTEASGRFHTDWLNMMYPRLKLARNLLRHDGVLFVSCDDNEVANLSTLLNEVFGEENFIATVIWQKIYAPKNSARHFSEDHDYIVVYARNAEQWRPLLLPRSKEMEARYINPDNDSRGPWKPDNLVARNFYSKGIYSVTCPSGRVIEGPPPGSYWRVSKEKFEELDRDSRIWWGKDGNNVPALKRFLSEVQQGRVPQTFWPYKEVGHTQDAKKQLMELVSVEHRDNVLDTVKPTPLIRRMLQIATKPKHSDIVLDFFAGSGPTGQSVLEQNSEDGGNRRYVLVQIPVPLPKPEAELKSISDITKTRLRGASKKLEDDNPDWNGDTGFRVFKLDSSNIRAWEPDPEDIEKTLLDNVEHIKEGRSEEDVLYELLLKLGLDLCVPIEKRIIDPQMSQMNADKKSEENHLRQSASSADKQKLTIHAIGGGVLIACLEERIPSAAVEPLALGIADWHKELDPLGESTVVFRDSAFPDDVAKTNLTAILQQHGLENVRSL